MIHDVIDIIIGLYNLLNTLIMDLHWIFQKMQLARQSQVPFEGHGHHRILERAFHLFLVLVQKRALVAIVRRFQIFWFCESFFLFCSSALDAATQQVLYRTSCANNTQLDVLGKLVGIGKWSTSINFVLEETRLYG